MRLALLSFVNFPTELLKGITLLATTGVADLALLGRSAEIRPYLDEAIEKGDADAKFKRQLLKFLGESGYL